MASKRKNGGPRIGSLLHDALFYDDRIGQLSMPAFRLLIELIQQYHGFNNGNLTATMKTLRFDWADRTLKNAKKELLAAELIHVTRPGVKRRPTLYALSHLPIDDCDINSIKATRTCAVRATGNRSKFFPFRKDEN